MKKRIFLFFTTSFIIITLSLSAFAHSGKTDGSGGHRDNKNKSGLGSYHYHCGGYPPHLHSGGVCPYKGGGSTSSSSNNASSASKPQKTYATNITVANLPTKINAGESTKLQASVYPSNAEDQTIYWESSDTNVLVVSDSGTLNAVGVGTATITAKTSRGTSKKFTITVSEIVAENISLESNIKEILIGDKRTLECKFSPENTTDKTVQWSSDNEDMIAVSANGEIYAKKLGFATITATHKELTASINIEVKPIDAEKITIKLPDNAETTDDGFPKLKNGNQMELKADIKPENTTFKDITWSVDKDSVATIDENGIITSHSTGTVIVTATAKNGVSDKIEIKVYSNTKGIMAGIVVAGALVGGVLLHKKKKNKASE